MMILEIKAAPSPDNYSKIEALLQEKCWALVVLFPFFLFFMSKLVFQGCRKSRLEAEFHPHCPEVGFAELDV